MFISIIYIGTLSKYIPHNTMFITVLFWNDAGYGTGVNVCFCLV